MIGDKMITNLWRVSKTAFFPYTFYNLKKAQNISNDFLWKLIPQEFVFNKSNIFGINLNIFNNLELLEDLHKNLLLIIQ